MKDKRPEAARLTPWGKFITAHEAVHPDLWAVIRFQAMKSGDIQQYLQTLIAGINDLAENSPDEVWEGKHIIEMGYDEQNRPIPAHGPPAYNPLLQDDD